MSVYQPEDVPAQDDLTAQMTTIIIDSSDEMTPKPCPAVIGTIKIKTEPVPTVDATQAPIALASESVATPLPWAIEMATEGTPELWMECDSDQPSDATSLLVSSTPVVAIQPIQESFKDSQSTSPSDDFPIDDLEETDLAGWEMKNESDTTQSEEDDPDPDQQDHQVPSKQ